MAIHRIIKLRHRHFFTRSNRLRLRYIAGFVVVLSLVTTSFLGSIGSSIAFSPAKVDLEHASVSLVEGDEKLVSVSLPASSEALERSDNFEGIVLEDITKKNEITDQVLSPLIEMPEDYAYVEPLTDLVEDLEQAQQDVQFIVSDEVALNSVPYGPVQQSIEPELTVDIETIIAAVEPQVGFIQQMAFDQSVAQVLTAPREEILKIRPGDTIAGALQTAGVNGAEAYRIVKAMGKHYDPRLVKPGQAISIRLEPAAGGLTLAQLNMKVSSIEELEIKKDDYDRYQPDIKKKKIYKQLKAAKAKISSSLYASAARAGIPASVIAEMIRIYSYEVDFQRDIRKGDTVEILYETYETEDGDFARYGNILFANLKVLGHRIPIYRFEEEGGVEYFRENGMNLKNTLMQTPIDGARMSSGYGMRRHPVLGYNKMHKGVDFAAPRGTPIYAAGDGVIEKAGRNGGYGNYVRIRHINSLKTAYAHMHRFAKGMKPGKRVKQGQVIGYVGSTGRSTGPHLHFEVLRNDKHVNPKSIKSSNREKLAGKRLKNFKQQSAAIKQKYATLKTEEKFAQN